MNIPMYYPGGASQTQLFFIALLAVIIVSTIGYLLARMAFHLYVKYTIYPRTTKPPRGYEDFITSYGPHSGYSVSEEDDIKFNDWGEVSPDFQGHLD